MEPWLVFLLCMGLWAWLEAVMLATLMTRFPDCPFSEGEAVIYMIGIAFPPTQAAMLFWLSLGKEKLG